MIVQTVWQRFISKVEIDFINLWAGVNTPCWKWVALKTDKGYGQIYIKGKYIYAHRYIWEKYNGKIPPKHTIDHLCRNPACVRPDHLEVVTYKENVRRGINANSLKTHCKRGHLYNEENTYINSLGGRKCRICDKTFFQRNRLNFGKPRGPYKKHDNSNNK